jgi:hypothetical protein
MAKRPLASWVEPTSVPLTRQAAVWRLQIDLHRSIVQGPDRS